jgi:hypothetical protein
MADNQIKVGDFVHVIGKDDHHYAVYMDKYINDGNTYEVKHISINGSITLSNTYYYRPSSLSLVKGKGEVKKAPKPPRIKVYKTLRSELHARSKGKTGGCCSYAFTFNDGTRKLDLGAACHASLGYKKESPVKELVYGLSFDERKVIPEHKAAFKLYVDYILNKSPWRGCFITKKYDVGVKREVLMNVTRSKHRIAAACIALRMGREWQSALLDMFKEMLDKGYSGHTAIMFGMMCIRRDKDKIIFNAFGGGHQALHRGMCVANLALFFKKGYVLDKKNKPFTQDSHYYSVFNYIESPTAKTTISFYEFVKGFSGMREKLRFGDSAPFLTNEQLYAAADKFESMIKEAK